MAKLSVPAKRRVVSGYVSNFRVEPMETRTLLSVSVNAQGFTTITPPAGARVIYCSSSTGSDAHSGLSSASPVKTLAKAESLLRSGNGDELLLKDGDTWSETFGVWTKSGASASSPMVIGSYGTGARPRIFSGSLAGFLTVKTAVSNLAVMGIDFDSNTRDPALTKTPDTHASPTGFDFQSAGSNILIENCKFENYAINVNIEAVWGTPSNITLRHNIIVNAWAIHGHAEGLYALGVHGLSLYGNDFDHNGYSDVIPYATMNIYNQDAYLSYDNTGVVVKDNVFARAASTGLQARSGGIVSGNYFVNNPVDMTFGLVNGAHSTAGGVSGSVTDNVFMGGANIGSLLQGIGLEVGNVNRSGATISNNVFSTGETISGPAIMLTFGSGQTNPTQSVGLNNVTLSNNTIYTWKSGIDFGNGQTPGGSGLTAFNNVSIINNKLEYIPGLSVEQQSKLEKQEHWSGNEYYAANTWLVDLQHARPIGTVLSKPIPFAAPTRSGATYDKSLGHAGTVNDLLALEANQSALNFNASLDAQAIVNYISAGFAS
jgi:hypothetical protein